MGAAHWQQYSLIHKKGGIKGRGFILYYSASRFLPTVLFI